MTLSKLVCLVDVKMTSTMTSTMPQAYANSHHTHAKTLLVKIVLNFLTIILCIAFRCFYKIVLTKSVLGLNTFKFRSVCCMRLQGISLASNLIPCLTWPLTFDPWPLTFDRVKYFCTLYPKGKLLFGKLNFVSDLDLWPWPWPLTLNSDLWPWPLLLVGNGCWMVPVGWGGVVTAMGVLGGRGVPYTKYFWNAPSSWFSSLCQLLQSRHITFQIGTLK